MIGTVRKIARTFVKVGNTCLNPTCLHATRDPKCSCCRSNHGAKKTKAKTTRRKGSKN